MFAWAEEHLRAVMDKPYPKLIPSQQANGHCHWLVNGRCAVHANAPFGCAFFDAHMSATEVERRSRTSTQVIREDARNQGLYYQVWRHLVQRGLISPPGNRDAFNEEVRQIQRARQSGR